MTHIDIALLIIWLVMINTFSMSNNWLPHTADSNCKIGHALWGALLQHPITSKVRVAAVAPSAPELS